MLSDTHIHTVQWCSSNAFSNFMYKQIPFYRGDRDRSQRQARWEMRHNDQQFFFFLDFLMLTCTEASFRNTLEYSFHVMLHLFTYSTQYVEKPEQQEGTLCSSDFTLKHAQPGSPMRKWVYLMEAILKHVSSFWNHSLKTRLLRIQFSCCQKPHHCTEEGGWPQKSCSQRHIFFECKQSDGLSSTILMLDSKSVSVHFTKCLYQSSYSVQMWRRIRVFLRILSCGCSS